jgi:glycerol uptake facilitator-like aquaporin
MIDTGLARKLTAEALGTCVLVCTVVGSGIMAEQLSGGNIALALLGNTIPTGAILVVLISVFGSISGAHFNPIVSFAMACNGALQRREFFYFTCVQIFGGIAGVLMAHAMFELPIFEVATKLRWGQSQWISEAVASFGLLLVIFGALRNAPHAVAMIVGLYITAAYWFTASTSFANPAVTIARAFTNSFAGISPSAVFPFIAAQFVGAGLAILLSRWIFK